MIESFYKKREVKDKKEVTVSGNNYTAYLILEEQWTSATGCDVKTDNPYFKHKMEKMNKKLNKKITEAVRKQVNANTDGYLVYKMEHWYIPGIGTYSLTTYDNFDQKVGYMELEKIEL